MFRLLASGRAGQLAQTARGVLDVAPASCLTRAGFASGEEKKGEKEAQGEHWLLGVLWAQPHLTWCRQLSSLLS